MASRKSGKDVPAVPAPARASKDAQQLVQGKAESESERPGSYAKVVGTPRRRRSSHPPIVAEAPGQVDRVGTNAAKYQVDRTSSMPPEPAEPTPAGRRGSVAEALLGTGPMKTSLGLGPNLQAEVERVFAERRPSENEAVLTAPSVLEASSVRIDRVQPISTPAPVQIVTRPSVPDEHVSASQAPRPRVSERPARPSSRETGVLDARPSYRPSDPVKHKGPSWGMVAGIAALSSIIAAAGVVAVQEMFKEKTAAVETVTPVMEAAPLDAPEPGPVQVGAAVAEEPAKTAPAAAPPAPKPLAPSQGAAPAALTPGSARPAGQEVGVRPAALPRAQKPGLGATPAVPASAVEAVDAPNRVLSSSPASPPSPAASDELPSNPYE